MKNAVRLFTITLLVFLMSGCAKQEPVKIGFLLHAFDKERWENDRDYFVARAEELGATVSVMDAGNDAETQLKQARQLLSEGVKVLVVVPVDQFAAASIVEEAHKNQARVVSYDRLILNCKLDYYISTDNVEIGELQADYLTRIKPQGSYALLGGARSDHNSQFLYLGQMNILSPLIEKGDVTLVYNTFTEQWSEEEGYTLTLDLLSKNGNKVDAIIAGNDAIAVGVIRALEEKKLAGSVLVAGMDADLKNLQEIVKGTQTCTIFKPIQKMASAAAEIGVRLAKGEACDRTFKTTSNGEVLVPSILENGVVVTRDNLKLTVVSEGYQKEEDIFK
jgi:D-xylose transport system substrate-binding protein